MTTERTQICLSGLSGSSLLGFMATLGAFKTLAELPDAASLLMTWTPTANSYAPVLGSSVLPDRDGLLAKLHAALASFRRTLFDYHPQRSEDSTAMCFAVFHNGPQTIFLPEPTWWRRQ